MRYLKALYFLIGSVLIATAGEGVWELVVKPAYPVLLNSVVRLSTFGVRSLEDQIYQEIAKGDYERTSAQLFITVQLIFIFAGLMVIPFTYIIRRKASKLYAKTKKIGDRSEIDQDLNRIFSIASTVYEVKAEANIRQLILIDSPYIDDGYIKRLRSKAASIRNKQDYEILVKQLKEIATSNHVDYPNFDIMS